MKAACAERGGESRAPWKMPVTAAGAKESRLRHRNPTAAGPWEADRRAKQAGTGDRRLPRAGGGKRHELKFKRIAGTDAGAYTDGSQTVKDRTQNQTDKPKATSKGS
jgi:hypothetical protein